MKVNISAYARDNGIDWRTAKKILSGNTERKKRTVTKPYKLEPYMEVINEKLEMYNYSAVSIYELVCELGFDGSESTVRKYVSKKKAELNQNQLLRVEKNPGLQGQVDWKNGITLYSRNGEKYRVTIFLFMLSYSKYNYVELTLDRKQTTLFDALNHAFNYCGGIPKEIWFDNMPTVLDKHDINTNEIVFDSELVNFANDYGFTPIACRPYRPCTKDLSQLIDLTKTYLESINGHFNDFDELQGLIKQFNEYLNNHTELKSINTCPSELYQTFEKIQLHSIPK